MSVDVILLFLRLAAAVVLLIFVAVATYWLWHDSIQVAGPRLVQLQAGQVQRQWWLTATDCVEVDGIALYFYQDDAQGWWLKTVTPDTPIRRDGDNQQLPLRLTPQTAFDVGENTFWFYL
jgi:hypothetical protein